MAAGDTYEPTLNWKDVALRLARTIEQLPRDYDCSAMDEARDAAKDARLFAGIFPCPSVKAGDA